MNGHPQAGRVSAFTLIELLAVISIITALFALLLPVAVRANQHARSAQCQGRLKNLGAGLLMYAGENYGHLPICHTAVPAEQPEDWAWHLKKNYGFNVPEVFLCAANTARFAGTRGVPTSYAIHTGLRDWGGPLARIRYRPPSRLGLLTDGAHNWLKESQPERLARLHGEGRANLLYVDGHVAGYSPPPGPLLEFYHDYWRDP